MSSSPNNQFPNLPAPNLSGANLPQRPSYLDSSMPDPEMIRQQINQSGGRQMPPMPGDFSGGGGNPQGGGMPSGAYNSPRGGSANSGQGLPPLPPIGANGSWQGNVPPPQPLGGMPMSAFGIPAFKPGMNPNNIQPPSQAQMANLRNLINQSIAQKQLTSPSRRLPPTT